MTKEDQLKEDHSNAPEDRELERRFNYHAPDREKAARHGMVRNEIKRVAYLITDNCPESRERSLAMTKLEEAMMWANAAIARN